MHPHLFWLGLCCSSFSFSVFLLRSVFVSSVAYISGLSILGIPLQSTLTFIYLFKNI